MQNVDSNYDTDLIYPLIEKVEEISGQTYYKDHRGFPFRVIADHARSCTFLICDGVLPSNEGRGYVLRRLQPGNVVIDNTNAVAQGHLETFFLCLDDAAAPSKY